ncbi:MAG: helix-turn-helix transcriptional regulator [bacterium]|nr:helix-turn-helix transcriptional regulator [bacterium]
MNRQKDDLTKFTEKLVKRNPSFQEQLDKADQAWNIAFQIRILREEAGLTQKKLGDLVNTKQSNIARLESADYTGYTLKTLEKVVRALRAKLEIRIVTKGRMGFANP